MPQVPGNKNNVLTQKINPQAKKYMKDHNVTWCEAIQRVSARYQGEKRRKQRRDTQYKQVLDRLNKRKPRRRVAKRKGKQQIAKRT